MVLLFMMSLLFFLGFFLLVMLMECKSTGSSCHRPRNLLFNLMPVSMFRVLLSLVLFVQGISSGSKTSHLTKVLKMLVMLLVSPIIMFMFLMSFRVDNGFRCGLCRILFLLVVVEEMVVVVLLLVRHRSSGYIDYSWINRERVVNVSDEETREGYL